MKINKPFNLETLNIRSEDRCWERRGHQRSCPRVSEVHLTLSPSAYFLCGQVFQQCSHNVDSLPARLDCIENDLTHSFIHPSIRSFVHSFTHSFIYLFIHSLIYSLTHSLTHSLIYSLTYFITYLLIHLLIVTHHISLTYSLTHSLAHLLSHLLHHSPTHSLIHPLILTHLLTYLLCVCVSVCMYVCRCKANQWVVSYLVLDQYLKKLSPLISNQINYNGKPRFIPQQSQH